MKKLLVTTAAAAFLIGTGFAMAADSAGGNGPQGSTGTTANAPSQPDKTTGMTKMAPGGTTGAGMEDKDAKKGNVSAKDKLNTESTEKNK